MNKTIFIIGLVIAIFIGTFFLLTKVNPEVKKMAEQIGLLDTPKFVAPTSSNSIFVIFDPSGSGRDTYSVPRINVDFISDLLDSISAHGTGNLWVTYISRSAFNTNVLHYEINAEVKPLVAPVRQAGQRLGDFNRQLVVYKKDSILHQVKVNTSIKRQNEDRKLFLDACQDMISEAYGPKKPGQDYSDIIGAINTALRAFSTIAYDSTHFRAILLISDGVQDVPKSDPHQVLRNLPQDILTIEVNHTGSRNDIMLGKALQVDNLQAGAEKIIRSYKHQN